MAESQRYGSQPDRGRPPSTTAIRPPLSSLDGPGADCQSLSTSRRHSSVDVLLSAPGSDAVNIESRARRSVSHARVGELAHYSSAPTRLTTPRWSPRVLGVLEELRPHVRVLGGVLRVCTLLRVRVSTHPERTPSESLALASGGRVRRAANSKQAFDRAHQLPVPIPVLALP